MQSKLWLIWLCLGLQLSGTAPVAASEIYPPSEPAYTQSLNGNWSFKYLPTLDAGADAGFTSPAVDVAHWGTIAVPANWELQGHAEPSYADTLKDGLGLYRRSFSVPAHWKDRRTFLRFDGVAFGYEVWVNGKQAGASSASAFNRHTFDVTDLLQDGANVLAVRVTTKPLGYEFDLNDDWSLSGIYRDVTLLSLPALHVQDIDSTTTVRSDGSAALALTVQLSQPAGEVRAQLFDPSGKRVADALLAPSAQHRTATLKLELAQPRLWTAETPSLYRLVLQVSQHGKTMHTVEQRIGLRQVSVDGKRLLVNGKPIKLRGVNHHDLDPVTGRAVTEAQIRQDLALMKKGNVNYVRTAHYPPHPRLLELCDELGFYVMDEVAIGHGEKHLDDPAYRDNILARARATVARDKHHASVIIWSIGNENPISEVEFEAGRLVKQLDPTRPITYPKIGSYFAKNYERIPPFVDLYSPHYPSNATLAGYADKLTRPTILTEYAHALGLATDRMQDQWAMLQANPVFAGGSLWHFHDQGLLRRSQTPVDPSKPTQLVWRDAYQYYDTNGLDGSDGLVYADRTPQVDFWQMRKVYAPVQFLERSAPVQTGRQKLAVRLENRYDFRSLAGVTLHWVLEHNGKAVQQGKTALSAPAHQRQTVNIAVDIPAQRTAYADVLALRLSAVDRDGLQINERTLRLLRPGAAGFDWTPALPVQATPVVHDTDEKIEVRLAQWNLTVQRSSGALDIRDRNGRVLVAGIHPHSGRRLTMAEALGAAKSGVWQASVLDQITSPVITAVSNANGVRVSVRGAYKLPQAAQASAGKSATAAPDDLIPTGDGKPAATHVQGLSGGYQLDINRQGAITVSYDYRPLGAGVVAEAGLSLVAPAGMEEFRWIGQGPYAGYPGKDQLNDFGLHHLNRADLHFQGNRRGTALAVLTDGGGAGMALATLPADVAVERHGSATLLSHNALIGGLGNKGTQPETIVELDPQRQISGTFTLLPVTMDGHGRWPAALVGWFGQPTPACDVYQPFFHSYDQ
ncbi:MAG: glycoside hydrolase family 2 TIM barrel-domain containing protein [Duganella sp.]